MSIYRMQVSFGADSALPRDRFVITPHFRNAGGILTDEDATSLTDDLADALLTWRGTWSGLTREIIVKCYDAQKAPPSYPLHTAVRDANAYPASAVPREVAVCLSFYNERNIPRHRGRLYIPAPFLYGTSISQARPAEDKRAIVAGLVPIFTGLGGPDIDWCVYSRRDDTARPVTHWYVDDEFDVQRRRGLRATTRTVGTTTEAGLP